MWELVGFIVTSIVLSFVGALILNFRSWEDLREAFGRSKSKTDNPTKQ